MKSVRTPSFKLAVHAAGPIDAPGLALLLPGKLDTKDYEHMQSHVEYLARRGFYAVSFDPPGSWESAGDLSLYTVTNYAQAVSELIAHFGRRATFLMGHSLGGSIAVLAALQNPEVFGIAMVMSIVAVAPRAPDLQWQDAGFRKSLRDIPKTVGKQLECLLPYGYYEDAARYYPEQEIVGLTIPKLFIAGKGDSSVNSEATRACYHRSPEPKEFELIDSDHSYRRRTNCIKTVNDLVGSFLDRHSGATFL